MPYFRASMGALLDESMNPGDEIEASVLTARVKKSQNKRSSSGHKKKKKGHKSRSKALASQMDTKESKQDEVKALPQKKMRDKLNGMVHGSKGHLSRMALSLDDDSEGIELNAETKVEVLDDDDDDNDEAPGAHFLGRMAACSDVQSKKQVPPPRPQARTRVQRPTNSSSSSSGLNGSGKLPRPLPVVRSPNRYMNHNNNNNNKTQTSSRAIGSLGDASDSDQSESEPAHAKDSSPVALLDDLEALAAEKTPEHQRQQDSPLAGKRCVASPRPKSPVKPLPRPAAAAVRGRRATGKQNAPALPSSSSSSSSESDKSDSDSCPENGTEECVAVLNDLEALAEKVPEQHEEEEEEEKPVAAGKKAHANTSRPRSPVKPLPRARGHSPVPRPNCKPPSSGDGDVDAADDGPRHTTL